MSSKTKQQELGITVKKEDNMSEWYTQVIQKADLIEYTDVAGCMIFKPNSYQIWEKIQSYLDGKIKKSGVKNAYFPLLIPEKLLTRESEHIEGFAPEVAWVTETGNSKLNERLAIRPTSETIMYEAYSKWIKSYRDLPLRLNQWSNVVRWEFSHATPFLRNREFLWQEGHSAYATKEEAEVEVREILDYYAQVHEELLAIPVDKGRKSVGEKFAGADYTLTIEAFLWDGKAIQGSTAHHLGQNFSKPFNIEFLDKNQKKQFVYQNSWGLTTRTIGTMIVAHSDNKGLVLPPKVANNKVVIIPLFFKGKEEKVLEVAKELEEKLITTGAFIDERTYQSPGFKYSEWELKGIPLRIEIGPRDIDSKKCVVVRRDTSEKIEFSLDSKNLLEEIETLLDNIQKDMFERAKKITNDTTVEVHSFEEFKKTIKNKQRCLVPWAEDKDTEDEIKEKTGAKTSCIPFEYEQRTLKGMKCFYSGKSATCWAYFCKSH